MFVWSLVVLAFVCVAQSSPIVEDPLYPAFRAWQLRHSKTYALGSAETTTRFMNFKRSVEIVNGNNDAIRSGKAKGAMFSLNKFADLSAEEFRERYFNPSIKATPEEQREYVTSADVAAPTAFDWRSKGKVTKVKNQGQCGSCWAFSATENIESVWMLYKGITNATMTPLSPQQIVDCDGFDGGCDGGDTPTAFKYVINAGGIETEKDYPYEATDGKCRFVKDKITAHITGFKYLTKSGDEKTLLDNTYSVAPASICVDAARWQYYDHGVMTAAQCTKHIDLDHCVQLVGYDISATEKFWSVRNSWGEDWGEQGYIRFEYGKNACGVTEEATTATIH